MLDDPPTQSLDASTQQLRTAMAAMRLSFCWWGVRKSLTNEQKAQAAQSFGAEGSFLSAGKKLIDTSNAKFKIVTGVRTRAVQFWKAMSLPYPEAGVRLIKREDLAVCSEKMESLRGELNEAVEDLNRDLYDLKYAARQTLGNLYSEVDYPETLIGLFEIAWDFPNVEPPDYLRRLNPQLYEQECQRVQARFEEAVQLAEQAFTEELHKLVSHLTERLAGADDGKPKVFRDTAVTNLSEFFERFQRLNIRSNEQLDELVGQCQGLVSGLAPQSLRENQVLRDSVSAELSGVQSLLDDLLVDRPRRNILRRPR